MCRPWGFAGWGVFTTALEDGNNNHGKRERQAGGREEEREKVKRERQNPRKWGGKESLQAKPP